MPGRSLRDLPRGPIAAGPAGEVDRLVKLFERSRKLGDDFESSVKTGLLAVLCSNNFLYLVEGSAKVPTLASERLGACLAALLFPLEHDAGRAAARPGRSRARCIEPDVWAAKSGG